MFGPLIVSGLLSDICVGFLVCAPILFIKVILIYAIVKAVLLLYFCVAVCWHGSHT